MSSFSGSFSAFVSGDDEEIFVEEQLDMTSAVDFASGPVVNLVTNTTVGLVVAALILRRFPGVFVNIIVPNCGPDLGSLFNGTLRGEFQASNLHDSNFVNCISETTVYPALEDLNCVELSTGLLSGDNRDFEVLVPLFVPASGAGNISLIQQQFNLNTFLFGQTSIQDLDAGQLLSAVISNGFWRLIAFLVLANTPLLPVEPSLSPASAAIAAAISQRLGIPLQPSFFATRGGPRVFITQTPYIPNPAAPLTGQGVYNFLVTRFATRFNVISSVQILGASTNNGLVSYKIRNGADIFQTQFGRPVTYLDSLDLALFNANVSNTPTVSLQRPVFVQFERDVFLPQRWGPVYVSGILPIRPGAVNPAFLLTIFPTPTPFNSTDPIVPLSVTANGATFANVKHTIRLILLTPTSTTTVNGTCNSLTLELSTRDLAAGYFWIICVLRTLIRVRFPNPNLALGRVRLFIDNLGLHINYAPPSEGATEVGLQTLVEYMKQVGTGALGPQLETGSLRGQVRAAARGIYNVQSVYDGVYLPVIRVSVAPYSGLLGSLLPYILSGAIGGLGYGSTTDAPGNVAVGASFS